MAIDPPYRLDPLQNVVNVKWGGGLSFAWSFFAEWGSSGTPDCHLGPLAIGFSTTSMTLTLLPPTPPEGFTVSGAPSVSGSLTVGAGSYAALAFIPDSKSGEGPGSATFDVYGQQCSETVPLPTDIAGSFTVTIPMITITDTEDTGEGTVYELASWSAVAAAGINVSATFEVSDTE